MKLQIERVLPGGSGLAHTGAGEAVVIPFTLPGETVEAELGTGAAGGLEGVLQRVAAPSPDRVTPRCPHFGACGGCQLQHACYDAQLALKHDILRETLGRAGITEQPEIRLLAGEPWLYRNRIRLRLERPGGLLQFGYNRRATNEFLGIAECPIAAPLLLRAAAGLLAVAAESRSSAKWLEAVAEVEWSCTRDETQLQALLLLGSPLRRPGFTALCEALHGRVPELVGAGAVVERSTGDRRPVPGASWGAEGLLLQAAGRQYWVARGGFFQNNRMLVDALVHLVTDGRRGVLAWDLFSGAGLFARALAESFATVTAIETTATASADLRRTAPPNLHVITAPVARFLRQALVERDRPELIVLDPPRAGAGLEGARLIARLSPREIVYVSCDPATLARDLRAMLDSGYNLAELHLVDLFPQTFHLETVAVLQHA